MEQRKPTDEGKGERAGARANVRELELRVRTALEGLPGVNSWALMHGGKLVVFVDDLSAAPSVPRIQGVAETEFQEVIPVMA